ncbi:MAG: phosphoribosylanthranilate isomerase [Rhodospirillales bacterium]
MALEVKICGLNEPESLAAAVAGGAAMVGFVFFPRSPRNVTPGEAASLARRVPDGVTKVGLLVDPDDDQVAEVLRLVPLDLLQLHGSETPARVAALGQRFDKPIMKVIKVATRADIDAATAYEPVAQRLLFDAKPPSGMKNALPGGNAVAFDWRLLSGRSWSRPWMLAGALEAANLAEAVESSGARAVDVSSGVESAPGRKDPGLIADFLERARSL